MAILNNFNKSFFTKHAKTFLSWVSNESLNEHLVKIVLISPFQTSNFLYSDTDNSFLNTNLNVAKESVIRNYSLVLKITHLNEHLPTEQNLFLLNKALSFIAQYILNSIYHLGLSIYNPPSRQLFQSCFELMSQMACLDEFYPIFNQDMERKIFDLFFLNIKSSVEEREQFEED